MSTPAPPSAPGTTAPAEGMGALRVAVDTPSHLFNRTVPVEIRDESMALVQRTESGREVPLPEGLYQVSAVLQDGVEYTRIVKVEAGTSAQSVRLAAPESGRVRAGRGGSRSAGAAAAASPVAAGAPPVDDAELLGMVEMEMREPRTAAGAPAAMPAPAASAPPPPSPGGMRIASRPRIASSPLPPLARDSDNVTFSASISEGGLARRAAGIWSRMKSMVGGGSPQRDSAGDASNAPVSPSPHPFPPQAGEGVAQQQQQQAPAASPSSDATEGAIGELHGAAIVAGDQDEWRLRLEGVPVSVATATVRVGQGAWRISLPVGPGDGECLLRVEAANMRLPVTAWIAPERTMVAALQNMLLNGEYAALVPVAEQAIELLRSKYQDPTGATLGALILHKVGGLQPYASWLENLARDFPWIPDGDVLLASLLVEDHQQLDRALQLALSVASRRVLHADTHSILLDMLRRWPDRGAVASHRDTIDVIARQCAYVARGSLYFCHAVTE